MEITFQRYIESYLQSSIGKGKVVLLTGARRVGKTILLQNLGKSLTNTLYLNAEDADTQNLLLEKRIGTYRTLMAGKNLVVIDEAQTIKEIGSILKLIIDELPSLPIVASGSSSFNLLNQSGEPLTGRYTKIELFPISWLELSAHFNPLELKQELDSRLIYGSYPELFQTDSSFEKRTYLKELVNSYLLRDILAFDGLRNTKKLIDLLKLVAYQVGNELSYEELGRQLGMSKNTVERYLYLLKEGYVLFQLSGYSNNLRKEVTKSNKWFFWDNGIRNAIINDFSPLSNRNDVGALWENFGISERLKKSSYSRDETEFHFWRTYDKQEIDLIENHERNLHAVELKYSKDYAKVPIAFSKAYPEAQFSLINKSNFEQWLK